MLLKNINYHHDKNMQTSCLECKRHTYNTCPKIINNNNNNNNNNKAIRQKSRCAICMANKSLNNKC